LISSPLVQIPLASPQNSRSFSVCVNLIHIKGSNLLFYDKEDYSFFGFSALIVQAIDFAESGYGRANDIDK
jgi:hypothetical protein